jgi:hypothetical protein
LQVAGCEDSQDARIEMASKNGQLCQQWDIIFADDWKDEPKSGEYWKEFGVKIGVGFHIISELSSHRYLDVLNQKNFVIKTPNGRSSQTWYFDWYTKTIKNAQTGKSMNIDNNGKGPGMIMMNTNSKWW